MSNRKKKFSISIFSPTAGCGGCGKPKLSDIVEPDKKRTAAFFNPDHHHPKSRFSSSSSGGQNGGLSLDDEDCTSTTRSTGIQSPVAISIPNSIAIEKNSDNPYDDFRQSILEMIIEKKIYSTNGLQELLNCFLQLNSPYHHEIIVRAFTEVSNEFTSHRL
ncbi:Transcription repressor OFP6, partial [Cucurbita argyrosperma subsp. sororia]